MTSPCYRYRLAIWLWDLFPVQRFQVKLPHVIEHLVQCWYFGFTSEYVHWAMIDTCRMPWSWARLLVIVRTLTPFLQHLKVGCPRLFPTVIYEYFVRWLLAFEATKYIDLFILHTSWMGIPVNIELWYFPYIRWPEQIPPQVEHIESTKLGWLVCCQILISTSEEEYLIFVYNRDVTCHWLYLTNSLPLVRLRR